MIRSGTVLAVLVSVAAGLGSYLATVQGDGQGACPGPAALSQWLGLSPEKAAEIERADPTYPAKVDELCHLLCIACARLAGLLENPSTTDEQVQAQVEQVIAAHDAVERFVARHVLEVRSLLSPSQQKRLMGLCATGARGGRRYRGGRGSDWQGRGRGPLADRLRLPPAQARAVHEADPGFAEEAADLVARLRSEQESLASLLEAESSPDDRILDQVEQAIAAHDALERRATRHVLAARPHLTIAQQTELLKMCATAVRRAASCPWNPDATACPSGCGLIGSDRCR